MRNFTLIVLALLAASTTTSAQSRFNPKKFQNTLKLNTEKTPSSSILKLSAKSRASQSALLLPTHEEAFSYEDGEWVAYSTYEIAYDSNGNVLTETEEMDGEYTKTVNTWNSDGMIASKTVSYSDDGETFTDNDKIVYTYDEKVKNLITESAEYYWQNEAWTLVSAGKTYKRIVKRNASGNVTSMELQTYYSGAYEAMYLTTTTYGSDGKPATIKFEELDSEDGTTYAMTESGTLTDIVWQNTDGQIVCYDSNDLFTDSNRIKIANITYDGETVGNISVSYDDLGGYEATAIYTGEDSQKAVMKLTYTDQNGSYTYENQLYEGDDETPSESEKYVCEYDSHHNCTLEESYLDGELDYAVKTDYTYTDGSDYPSQQIQSEYDSETGEYTPAFKVVSSDYKDVTSVKNISADDANAPETVYTTSGIRVANNSSQLPRGLYIVKKGAKTTKLLRR